MAAKFSDPFYDHFSNCSSINVLLTLLGYGVGLTSGLYHRDVKIKSISYNDLRHLEIPCHFRTLLNYVTHTDIIVMKYYS